MATISHIIPINISGDVLFETHKGLCINNKGHVTGTSLATTGKRVFFYDGMETHDLGTFGGGSSIANALNDSGVIVGHTQFLQDNNPRPTAFIFDGIKTYDLIHDPHHRDSSAVAVNNYGHVLIQCHGSHAYIHHNEILQLLNPSEDWRIQAQSMSDKGHVVGWFHRPGAISWGSAFQWDGRQFFSLFDDTVGIAQDINEEGQIVGNMRTANGHKHAFLYESSVVHDLGSIGFWQSRAQAINNHGDIVGFSWYSGSGIEVSRALLWHEGILTDLNSLVEDTGWILKSALDINDMGQIVGFGEFNNTLQIFILTLE